MLVANRPGQAGLPPACAISANLVKSQGLVGNGMGVVVSYVGFFVWQGVAIYVHGA